MKNILTIRIVVWVLQTLWPLYALFGVTTQFKLGNDIIRTPAYYLDEYVVGGSTVSNINPFSWYVSTKENTSAQMVYVLSEEQRNEYVTQLQDVEGYVYLTDNTLVKHSEPPNSAVAITFTATHLMDVQVVGP